MTFHLVIYLSVLIFISSFVYLFSHLVTCTVIDLFFDSPLVFLLHTCAFIYAIVSTTTQQELGGRAEAGGGGGVRGEE